MNKSSLYSDRIFKWISVRCTTSEPFFSVKISFARATQLRRLIVRKLIIKMRAWRCILYTTVSWYEGVESASLATRIKIYHTFDRSAVKIHRRVFVSCSRVKACNFSGFVNITSETVLEKLSPLNELRNYGDRCGKLRRAVRKPQSPPAALRTRSFT